MTTYYHATPNALTPGEQLSEFVRDFSRDSLRFATEKLLEKKRPEGVPSRYACWYGCKTAAAAAAYALAENLNRSLSGEQEIPYRYYELSMVSESRHPIALVDAIRACLVRGDTSGGEILANEYWNPRESWKFWEYIAVQGTVGDERLTGNDLGAVSRVTADYSYDSSQAKKLVESSRA